MKITHIIFLLLILIPNISYSATISPNQYLGKQTKYTIHHSIPINNGGSVFDIDNLIITTPKYHKEILDPILHYGGNK